jgi:peptide chain release factor 3
MAAEREIIEEAYAGDIIGVFDPGIFSIGDTLCSPSKKFKFDPIPTFAPEHFQRIRSIDTMKRKQFLKGVEQIAQEGAIQIFKTPYTGMEEVIVGVVGTLQFDVLEYRLRSEYNVELYKEGLPYEYLRWIVKEDEDALDTFNLARMDADNERQNRYADEDELADAGFDYVADEEVDASYDDEGDEF